MNKVRKVRVLSIDEKKDILKNLEEGTSQAALAKQYGCSQSTVSIIKRNASCITNLTLDGNRTRNCISDMKDADATSFECSQQQQQRNNNVSISDSPQAAAAPSLALTLKERPSKISDGWKDGSKMCQGIKFSKIQEGKEAAGSKETLGKTEDLRRTISNYEPRNVYIGHETGLYFKAISTRILSKGGAVQERKSQKERLTAFIVANMDGSEKTAFVIGRHAGPRCLRKVKATPLPYFSNQNAWMTPAIWGNVLGQLNHKISLQNREIVLLVDDAAVHRTSRKCSHVRVVFLPKSTTSLILEFDKDVIKALKGHYRAQMVRKMVSAFESGVSIREFIKTVDILAAMNMLKRALVFIQPSADVECSGEAQAQIDTDVQSESLELPMKWISQEDFEIWLSCDEHLPCFEEVTGTDTCQIVAEFTEGCHDSDDDPVCRHVSAKQALQALYCLQEYVRNEVQDHDTMTLAALESVITQRVIDSSAQTKITDFFINK